MAVGNNSQTVGKNLVNNKGRYADIATVQALTGLEPGDFVVIEDIIGYDTNPLFNLSPELADGDFDPNAADYLAVWDGSTWEIIDQDTGGGGQGLMECVELILVSDGSKVQIFNAYFDTDSQEWVGSDGTVEVRYAAADVSDFNDCCCGVSVPAKTLVQTPLVATLDDYTNPATTVNVTNTYDPATYGVPVDATSVLVRLQVRLGVQTAAAQRTNRASILGTFQEAIVSVYGGMAEKASDGDNVIAIIPNAEFSILYRSTGQNEQAIASSYARASIVGYLREEYL